MQMITFERVFRGSGCGVRGAGCAVRGAGCAVRGAGCAMSSQLGSRVMKRPAKIAAAPAN
jgi:hypothetical protein